MRRRRSQFASRRGRAQPRGRRDQWCSCSLYPRPVFLARLAIDASVGKSFHLVSAEWQTATGGYSAVSFSRAWHARGVSAAKSCVSVAFGTERAAWAAHSADFVESLGAVSALQLSMPCRPSLCPWQSSFAVVSSPPRGPAASPSRLVVARASKSAFVVSAGPWVCCPRPFPSVPAPAAVGAPCAGCGSLSVGAARGAPAGRRASSRLPWTWPCSARESESQTRGRPQRPAGPARHPSGPPARARRGCCGRGGLWRVAPPGHRFGHRPHRRVSSYPCQVRLDQQELA